MIPNKVLNVYRERLCTEKPFAIRLQTGISENQCSLSLDESDGWFCEFEDDWKRRKQIHQIQDKRNWNSNASFMFFQRNWEPTIHCTFQERIGNPGDGGKWVCDIHNLANNFSTPLIYSIGSNSDFSFEVAIKSSLPNAEIHTFGIFNYTCPSGVCTFHTTNIGDGKMYGTKSLAMIINELGHVERDIDIMKIDIEGSEYTTFKEFFQYLKNITNNGNSEEIENKMPYIRQILIEVHLRGETEAESTLRVHELFELFRRNSYAIFHKEVNLYEAANVFEYSLIRLNEAFFNSSS